HSITILSHLNPDADTLGTALGIYALLSKDKRLKVEIVNASTALPLYLDFLPNFKRIKHHMEYTDSLILSCDCGSVDRLGFDLEGRDIINIDHHESNTGYGTINVVIAEYASASQVAFALFKELYTVESDAATCFYTALLSDTRYFTTTSVNEEVFNVARTLVEAGANPNDIAYHFTQRRSLSSLRLLEKALASLSLYHEAKIATLMVTKEDIAQTGATVPDMEGVVDYGRSLATVEVALFAMELENGIRISLRSKKADVSKVAMAFGGGGHKVAAGFTLSQCGLQESIDTILKKIEELGIINEK
ncbi:MAG: bifunctional oligoribonuclease/PAP phosphatase NrnA, partial [Sulfurovum sp.]|nr:DHH family phosphoesterase [Sulfurovum sp.]NNJ44640.1 bifunctional oligoribonuclease/PAP phosphatase NrnA [Sulfurovum sp.]